MNKERLTEILPGQKEVFSVKTGLIERGVPLEDALKASSLWL